MGLKSSHWSCLNLVLRATYSVLQYFRSNHLLDHSEAMNDPQKRSNDLERSKFCPQVQSFVFVHPWSLVTFKFRELLKNASEVTLVTKKNFFFFFSQKFWTWCKVSWIAKKAWLTVHKFNLKFLLHCKAKFYKSNRWELVLAKVLHTIQ